MKLVLILPQGTDCTPNSLRCNRSLDFPLSNRLTVTALIVLYILVQLRLSKASVTPTIGVGTQRIRVTCYDESGERRNGSSAGRSGEPLTGSGRLTNTVPPAPDCFRRMWKIVQPPDCDARLPRSGGIPYIFKACEKKSLCGICPSIWHHSHPNHCGGITTDSGFLHQYSTRK